MRSTRLSSIEEESIAPSNHYVDCGSTQSDSDTFHRHKLLAYSVSNGYATKFPWLREDLENTALLALLEAIQKFDETRGTKFSSFGYRVIRGRLLHFIRSEMRHAEASKTEYSVKLHDGQDFETHALSDSSPTSELETSEAEKRVRHSCDVLTNRERDVIRLLYWRDLSATDVARTLGVSNSRISVLATKARERLRATLTEIH